MEHRATKGSKVAVVRCDSYERESVSSAVREAVELLGGLDSIFGEEPAFKTHGKNAEIVLKLNLLNKAEPEKAVTTHPEVFRAVGELLHKEGYGNLVYGDSPGSPVPGVEKTAEGCGIKAVADELGIRLGDFEHGTDIEYPDGKAAKRFVLCNEIAKVTGADGSQPEGMIINLCKMKTHQLERITGAVKNTFGCVQGVNKAMSHARYQSPEHFARMLADLNTVVRPSLHIMDGIVAMEGNGPGSGDPFPMNAILVSTDPVALDTVFCTLICLDPQLVATNTACADAGVGTWDDEQIEILLGGVPMQKEGAVITLDELAVKYASREFNVQRSRDFRGSMSMMGMVGKLMNKRPVVIANRCVGCGICEQTCPLENKAVIVREDSAGNRVAAYDYSRCIKCYCCQEMCPERAITVKKSLLAKIVDRRWKV
ncbi:MAG: DUF362 domain-containing protein [Clostridia bacterium]|nr:DUF362 domain-containing protein [Clostridia bacterium]